MSAYKTDAKFSLISSQQFLLGNIPLFATFKGYPILNPDLFVENWEWKLIGSKISGTESNDNFGQSISISSDGSIIAVGAPYGGGNAAGQVNVYQFDGTSWSQLGQDLNGSAFDFFGFSIKLSSDGTVLAVGAIQYSNNGYVNVYKYNGTSWNQLGSTIFGVDGSSGYELDISSDGSIIAISSPNSNSSKGRVKVYNYNGTSWKQIGSDIDGESNGDFSGSSVSLSSDGTILAIGAENNDSHNPFAHPFPNSAPSGNNASNAGHTRVFKYNGFSWNQIGQDIDGENKDDNSGSIVSLSSDGTIVAIGAKENAGNGTFTGHTRVYKYDGTKWIKLGQDIDGQAIKETAGNSVSLSSDGSIVAIGASHNNDNGLYSGQVRVYQYDGISWNQIGLDIDGETSGDGFGTVVRLSSDSNYVVSSSIQNSYVKVFSLKPSYA